MKLLIITQKVDKDDSNLGFFHDWLDKMAGLADIFIIANEVKEYNLPENIKIYSLGKERKNCRIIRVIRYWLLLLKLLPKSDGIFFHMCPEYVLAAGFLPKIFRKKSLLWYTHKSVNWKLWLAEKLVNKIFTASRESFRLASKKVKIVGHGINVDFFKPGIVGRPKDLKLLTVGRISPVKDLEVLISAVAELKNKFPGIIFDIAGEPLLKEDKNYLGNLKSLIQNRGLGNNIFFAGAKKYSDLPAVYNSHNVFIHASRTGSMDKAVLEALACGLNIFTSSEAYADLGGAVSGFKQEDFKDLAAKIEFDFLHGKIAYNEKGVELIKNKFNLDNLIKKIIGYYAGQ